MKLFEAWNNGRTAGFKFQTRRFTAMVCKRVEPKFEGCFDWYFYCALQRDWVQPPVFRFIFPRERNLCHA